MFFSRRAPAAGQNPEFRQDFHRQVALPPCYDEFIGTKIYNIIEHPVAEGDRIFLKVSYAGSAAVKAHGGRWDPDARRWWYWSNSVEQLRHDDDVESWLHVLLEVHRASLFADWDMDTDYMRHRKHAFIDEMDSFDYCNPASAARAK
jgi:hypothetical protein